MSKAPRQRFEAEIYLVGILRCVDVPNEVGASLAGWRHPPVRVEIAGCVAHTHLVPRGAGELRLYVGRAQRFAAGVDTGDRVEIQVQLDPSAGAVPYPDDLLDVGESIDGGLEVLETLPPGLRRQVLDFLAGAKSPATRLERLRRVAELIRERVAKLDV